MSRIVSMKVCVRGFFLFTISCCGLSAQGMYGGGPEPPEKPKIVVVYPSDVHYMNNAVACSSDGNRIAASSWPGSRINIWDLRQLAVIRDLRYHKRSVFAMCFSPDDKKLASASHDGQVCLWNDETGTVTTLRSPVTYNSYGLGMCISPSGRYLAYSFAQNPHGGWLRETVVYDMSKMTEEIRLKEHCFPVFLPNDVLMTIALAKEWSGSDRGWLIQTRKLRGNKETSQVFSGRFKISAVAAATDGQTVALGSWQNIRIISLSDKRVVRELKQGFGGIRTLVFSPDSKKLIAINKHGRMWSIDIQKGKVAQFSKRGGRSVAFTPDGNLLIVGREAVELRDPATQEAKVLLRVIPWSDKPEWIAFTPEGYYKKSDGAGEFLRWRAKDSYIPFGVEAKSYDRPDLVLQALLRETPSISSTHQEQE